MMKRTVLLSVVLLLFAWIGASAARAGVFHFEPPPTYVSGSTWNLALSVKGRNVTCTSITFDGSFSGSAAALSLSRTNEGCFAYGFFATTMKDNGCVWAFSQKILGVGAVTLSCPKENEIVVDAGGTCVVSVPPQALGAVDYANLGVGSGREIEVNFTFSEFEAWVFGPPASCGPNGWTTETSMTGSVKLQGFENVLLTERVGLYSE